MVQPSTMSFRQPLCQLLIDTPIGPRDRLRADTLDSIQSRQQDAALPKHLYQPHRQHNASVRLHGRLYQFLNCVPVVNRRERFKVEKRLKFKQMLSPGLRPAPVPGPMLNRNL